MEKAIASLSRTHEILDRYGLKAQKKYGQNFLIDANIVDKIAKLSTDKESITIEIGPGIGSLTQMLAKYSKEVIAYEIDDNLIPVLSDNFKDINNIKIIHQDFLKADLSKAEYKDEEINICANLPYYITTPILFKLFESDLKIKKISVMVQKEVADRFKAKVNEEDYNALSVIVNYLYDVKVVTQVPSSVFHPRPRVDSTVISFIPKINRDREYEKHLFSLIKMSFVQRRKTLWNNLKGEIALEDLNYLYEKMNFKSNIRAQEIDIDTFVKMYEVLNERSCICKN